MSQTPSAPETVTPRLSDWEDVAHRHGPNVWRWLFAVGIFAGVMLFVSPFACSSITSSDLPLISRVVAFLLSPLMFLLGWLVGMSTFSNSCEHYRRSHRTWSLRYLLPCLLAAIVGLGLLGGRYWWLFAVALALLGHRKGTQRAWWAAVVLLAFVFRDPGIGLPLAQDDEQALALAKEAVNKEIGRK